MASEATYQLLPYPYAVALRMRAAGHDGRSIATALGLEPQAVELLLEIADRKSADIERTIEELTRQESGSGME